MSQFYGAVKDRLGLAQPWEKAYWQPHKIESLSALAGFIAVPLLGGFVIAFLCQKSVLGWYQRSVKKPKWTPPNWLFGLVWTDVYITMGIAAWRVWSNGGWTPNKFALSAFAVQLIFNLAWNPLFFLAKKIDLALIDIVALLGALTTTGIAFGHVDTLAGALFVPYFAWVAYATALTYTVMEKNPKYTTHYFNAPHLPIPKHD